MAVDIENVATLKKLSTHDNFEKLYREHFDREELGFLHEDLDVDFSEKMWQKTKNLERSVKGLYEALTEDIRLKVREMLVNGKSHINSDKIEETVTTYLIMNMARLSDRLITAEAAHHDMSEDEFIGYISDNRGAFLELFSKYPYWGTLVKRFLKDSQIFLGEIITRLIKDIDAIGLKFYDSKIVAEDIVLDLGDRHRGRFVVEIKSSKGDFFYKPRSIATDKMFQDFCDRLCRNEKVLDMKFPEFMDFGNYSWVKKVMYTPLDGCEEKKRFYTRLGQLVAAVYLLNGNDIHLENMISCGEYPVIIDTETILTSRMMMMKKSMSSIVQNKEMMYSFDSVKNSMILPEARNYKKRNINFSPIQVKGKETEGGMSNGNHVIEEDEIDAVAGYVSEGFRAVYWEVADNKEDYLDFFKKNFGDTRVRFLNKPTNSYSNVKNLLYNPVCLYDSDFAFAATSRLFDPKDGEVPVEELHEQEEVLLLNIPYFEVESDSKDLYLDETNIISDFFFESPMEGLEKKLEVLGDEDYKREDMIIQKSFELFSDKFVVNELCDIKSDSVKALLLPKSRPTDTSAIPEFVDEAIRNIFEKKCVNPFSRVLFWMDPVLEGDTESGGSKYRITDMSNSIYGGNIGILIAMLGLDNSDKYSSYIKKLREDIESDIDRLLATNGGSANIGAFGGVAAYIRYYIYLYRYGHISKAQLYENTKPLIGQILDSYSSDHKLDILDGAAGVISTVIELKHICGEDKEFFDAMIRKLRGHILNNIIVDGDDTYVPIEHKRDNYYSGFAHGSCGVILALYLASKELHTDDTQWIHKLLGTERKMYDPDGELWYRDNNMDGYSWGWCHGIPGILLARTEMYKAGYRDETIASEIRDLYDIAIRKAMGSNLTLCHGDGGNISICSYVAEVMGYDHTDLDDYASKLLPRVLLSSKLNIRGTEAVGLMSGISGIIMFLNYYYLKKDSEGMARILLGK